MKNCILLVSIILIFFGKSFSQITIADGNGNDMTNVMAFLPVSPEKVNFFITNQGAAEITFIVEVTAYTLPADATDFLVCACGNCLPASMQSTPFAVGDPTQLLPGATYDGVSDVEYLSNGSTAPANITIKVYEQGNESNTAQFTLDTEYTSVNEPNQKSLFTISPNPATDRFTITVGSDLQNSELLITNILGKTIKKVTLSGNRLQCSANDFAKGVYFVSIINKNRVLTTKKLVIQ
jgi:hypothetical protein